MELLEQVESYLAKSRMPPSTFGRAVVGDPRFVDDLREGRRPRRKTAQRVLSFLWGTEVATSAESGSSR